MFSIETEEVDRRNSREKIISGEGEAFIQNDILEEILHKEEKKRVWDAVNRLKGQKKEVILLQYFGDFSQKEIAAMLKITPGNVKVLSYRAKKELKEYLQGERKYFDVPLKLEGSEYQKKVWNIIRSIPYGKTITYKDVAIEMGKKKSFRAVGGAIGKNPLLIFVPCHRVIGLNGALTGYAGGIERKENLLKLEHAI